MSANRPTVSVIVPVYNTEKYLRRCLDSILGQTYTDWECLVIDDGSTDGSADICDEYAAGDARFRVFHKENGGVSSARNLGLDKSGGEYFIFMDSDDFWNRLECLQELVSISEDTGADLVRGEYRKVDENDNVLFFGTSKTEIENRELSSYEMLKYGIAGEFFGVLFLYRRNVIGDLRYDENMTFLEDMDFIARLFRKPLKCAYSPLYFYSYLCRTSSASNVGNVKNITCSFGMCDRFFDYSSGLTSEMCLYYQHYGRMMYYWTMNTISEDPYYAIRKDVIRDCGLKDLRKRLLGKTRLCKDWHYWILLISAEMGARVFRFKNRLSSLKKKVTR